MQQADVLWAFYLFPDTFDPDVERINYEFYAPKTVHEAPLSNSLHSILLAKQGDLGQSMKLLGQDQAERESSTILHKREGLDVPSLAGPFLMLVNGLAQAFVKDGILNLNPQLPSSWEAYSLNLHWQQKSIRVQVEEQKLKITNRTGEEILLRVREEEISLAANASWES